MCEKWRGGSLGISGAELETPHKGSKISPISQEIRFASLNLYNCESMDSSILKKRKLEAISIPKPAKKIRKQKYYSSPSSSAEDEGEDEFPAVNLADSESEAEHQINDVQLPSSALSQSKNTSSPSNTASETDQSSASEPTTPSKKSSKSNDPAAFATSISAILGSKLSSTKRSDPVLARSTTAAEANASIANSKLEAKARSKLREDKKEALEKGRVKDVLLGTDAGEDVDVGVLMEEEKRLRKTAQRGVVKLFNAVRQAQVRGEEAARNTKGSRGRKEEKVGEMSKKGFLELVAGGGGSARKGLDAANIEEA